MKLAQMKSHQVLLGTVLLTAALGLAWALAAWAQAPATGGSGQSGAKMVSPTEFQVVRGQIDVLSGQVRKDEEEIASLKSQLASFQSAMDDLKKQFSTHTHAVTVEFPGKPCMELNTYGVDLVGRQVQVPLFTGCPGGHPPIPGGSQSFNTTQPIPTTGLKW
jgi:hypothetical protein